jgi:hypothetical protein
MFRKNMTTHGSCAMVPVILTQTFLTLCKILIVFFLLHVMTHNAYHYLRLRGININTMVIHLKKGPCICWLLPCEPIFLVEFELDKQLPLSGIWFSLKNLLVVFTKLFVNNYFTITYFRFKPIATTPNPIFTKANTIISYKSIPFASSVTSFIKTSWSSTMID